MKCIQFSGIMMMVSILFFSCDTKTNQKTEATTTDSAVTTAPVAPSDLNSDQSELLETVLGSEQEEGTVLRGITFGDPISKVKATETFEMFEETADHLGYTSETGKLETIDVQYFLTKDKKVDRIAVDVYLNSADATKELWNAGKSHFTRIYSQPKVEGKKTVWTSKTVRVNMEDVSEGKDYGLKFQFFPVDKNVLAVN